MYIKRQLNERSKWRAVWDKGVRHEVQICVYCGGNGSISSNVCSKCLEKKKHLSDSLTYSRSVIMLRSFTFCYCSRGITSPMIRHVTPMNTKGTPHPQ
jgi:hypothetical protein